MWAVVHISTLESGAHQGKLTRSFKRKEIVLLRLKCLLSFQVICDKRLDLYELLTANGYLKGDRRRRVKCFLSSTPLFVSLHTIPRTYPELDA